MRKGAQIMLELNELLELEEVQLVPNTIKRETANFYAGIIGKFYAIDVLDRIENKEVVLEIFDVDVRYQAFIS